MSEQKFVVTYVCGSCDHKDEVEYEDIHAALGAEWSTCKACGKTIFRRTFGHKEEDDTTRTISCDEAINEITEILTQASGEWIADIYIQVSGKKAAYEGDSIIVVEELGEKK